MSLYGSLFSGVTGLTAQSRALGTISENITNVNTVGFKAQTTHFSSLVAAGNDGTGSVGGVLHTTSKQVDRQGILQTTESDTDIALAGGGFFVVNDDVAEGRAVGETLFSRAGHFAVNNERHLANASGHFLMGWRLNKDGDFVDDDNNVITPDATSDADLLPVDLSDVTFTSEGTDNITIKASFPAQMTIGDTFSASSRVFDDLGGTHNIDFDFTKADHVELTGTLTDDAGATFQIANIDTPAARSNGTLTENTGLTLDFAHSVTNADGTTWTVTVTGENGTVDPATASFDISFDDDNRLIDDSLREVRVEWDGGLNAEDSIIALDFTAIDFDPAGAPAATATVNETGAVLQLVPSTTNENDEFVSGSETFVQFDSSGNLVGPESLDMLINWDNATTFAPDSLISFELGRGGTQSGLSVSGAEFQLNSTSQDGIAFGAFTGVTIDQDGFIIANFKNGTFLPVYRVPLADFTNPNGLRAVNGNAFEATLESGDFFLNQPGKGGVGAIVPRALEQSTVDIAREFTNMIITQRAFSSASTVITTADEMLQELVQIKR